MIAFGVKMMLAVLALILSTAFLLLAALNYRLFDLIRTALLRMRRGLG